MILRAITHRPYVDSIGLLALMVGALLCPLPATGQSPSSFVSPEMLQDAELADVFFLDADRGWAVGDRGAIWTTYDGGRQWKLQSSGVVCRLESVWFIDEDNGWAVGGWAHPFTHKTTGVILRTRNGGQHWAAISGAALPRLTHVKFFDQKTGWASGDASAQYPSGVFHTGDGGRSWMSTSTAIPSGQAGDAADRGLSLLASESGVVSTLRGTNVSHTNLPNAGGRRIHDLKLASRTHGWLAGDGGLAMWTADSGATWNSPVRPLPQAIADLVDFEALAVHGNHCWLAGSPGSVVVHSADGGQTWDVFPTEQSLPLHGLYFLDEQRGWAVGALGTMLATRDGGRTWRYQRGGGKRAALLGIFGQPREIPLELFSRFAGNDSYLAAVEVLNENHAADRPLAESSLPQRTHQALVSVGACGAATAWQFPNRPAVLQLPADNILEGWARGDPRDGRARLEEFLVSKIRQWRPDVVVTNRAASDGRDAAAHLIQRALVAAVEKAADESAYADQIRTLKLRPWQVKKVFAESTDEQPDTLRFVTAQIAPRLGRTLSDHALLPRALVDDRDAHVPAMTGYRLLTSLLPDNLGRRDFFGGIVLQTGSDARREAIEAPSGNLDSLRVLAQRQRNISQMIAHTARQGQSGAAWLAQVEDLTQGLDELRAGTILFQLGQQYRDSGQWELAAEALQLLVQHHPAHELTEPALLWLTQYYASGEAAWRAQRRARVQSRAEAAVADDEDLEPQVAFAGFQQTAGRETSSGGAFVAAHENKNRGARVVGLTTFIERTRPNLYADPALRFALSATQRDAGAGRIAEAYCRALASQGTISPWSAAARGELWIAQPARTCPVDTFKCVRVVDKPYLDGRLDDAVWQHAESVELNSPYHDDAGWPAAAMIACDAEYLYVAVACGKAAGASYPDSDLPRPRDAELDDHDRIELSIDLDRDYMTYYRLTMDHRGWTSETCFGDKTWDPQWSVAAASDEASWTIELAIPLDELTGDALDRQTIWAVGLKRIVPGVGLQSWTPTASAVERPDDCRFLIFE